MSAHEAIDRDKLGEVIASVDDYDGCHARVREWEALEQWEKDAHPDEEPFSDREDVAYWNRRADAVIAHLALSAQEAATEVPNAERLAAEAKRANDEHDANRHRALFAAAFPTEEAATEVEPPQEDHYSSGQHLKVVHQGSPVCDTCTNVLGLNIRWDQARCRAGVVTNE